MWLALIFIIIVVYRFYFMHFSVSWIQGQSFKVHNTWHKSWKSWSRDNLASFNKLIILSGVLYVFVTMHVLPVSCPYIYGANVNSFKRKKRLQNRISIVCFTNDHDWHLITNNVDLTCSCIQQPANQRRIHRHTKLIVIKYPLSTWPITSSVCPLHVL